MNSLTPRHLLGQNPYDAEPVAISPTAGAAIAKLREAVAGCRAACAALTDRAVDALLDCADPRDVGVVANATEITDELAGILAALCERIADRDLANAEGV